MPVKKIAPVHFQDICNRYLRCEISTSDMAKECKVAKATILKWMDEYKIVRHHPSIMLSIKMKGKPSAALGKKRTIEQRKKMSASKKGCKPTTFGFKFSEESKQKMRNSAKGKDRTKMRDGLALWLAINRLPDSEVIARNKTRAACKRMLRRTLMMTGKRKSAPTEVLLGYTHRELRAHLESQFKDGMGWELRESFHIDHIKPVAAFFAEGVYDPSIINSLSNLQVLSPKENRAKSNKYTPSSTIGKPRKQALIIDKNGTRPWHSPY